MRVLKLFSNFPPAFMTLLFLSLSLHLGISQEVVPVKPAPDLIAHLDFPENRAVDLKSNDGTFELVKLAPDETVQMTVKWPATLPNAILSIDALDGGTLNFGSSGNIEVNTLGETQISFSTAGEPGEYRLKLRSGDHFWEMPVYVPNLASPASNPTALEPAPVDPEPVTETTPSE